METINYPKSFAQRCKELYPYKERLQELIEQGSPLVQQFLEGHFLIEIDEDDILSIRSISDSIQQKWIIAKQKKELYDECRKIIVEAREKQEGTKDAVPSPADLNRINKIVGLYNPQQTLNVGFVGYCSPTEFDENRAVELINRAFDQVKKDYPTVKKFNLVSGVVNGGTIRLAYKIAEERGWELWGVACKKAENLLWYPRLKRNNIQIIGSEWGEESIYFTDNVDIIVRVGGGPQSAYECYLLKQTRKRTYEFELDPVKESELLSRRLFERL